MTLSSIRKRLFAWLNGDRIPQRLEGGYLLPAVIALGLGISTISVLALQTVSTSSETLNSQQYRILAREAAKAGIQAAAKCLSSATATDRNWTGKVLRSADCAGSNAGSTTGYLDVASSDYYTTRFDVEPPDTSIQYTVVLTSIGSVVIKGPSGQPVKTFKETVRAFAKTGTSGANALPVDRISAGPTTACALADNWAYCWGSNSNGMLGNGWNYINDRSTVPISIAKGNQPTQASSAVHPCDNNIFTPAPTCSGAQVSSIANGMRITKISVGTDHACVLATDADGSNSRAHCWGNNDYGQLGTRNTTDAKIPVAVDTAAYVPAEVSTGQCGGFLQRSCRPEALASALHGRTVTDITAGNGFTCALMDDDRVACWGRNNYGQLGNDSRDDSSYPTLVSYAPDSQSDCVHWTKDFFGRDVCQAHRTRGPSALIGKGVKALADIKNAATMCVIDTLDEAYCWGQNFAGQAGIGGTLPSTASDSGSERHGNPNQCDNLRKSVFKSVVNSLPRYNYDVIRPVAVQTNLKFSQITISSNGGGADYLDSVDVGTGVNRKNIDEPIYSHVVGVTTSANTQPYRAYYWGGSVNFTGYVDCNRNGDTYGGDHSRATASITRTYVGQTTPAGPLYDDASGTTINRKPLVLSAGDAYGGLFCAVTANDIHCHGRGATGREGQLGNGQAYTCSGWFCTPPSLPTTPQLVDRTNVQPSLVLEEMDMGASGYTCVVASESVYCWGVNSSGQLGDGTTTNQNIPTPVATSSTSGSALYSTATQSGAPRDWVYF